MSTQTVSPETTVAVLDVARKLTDTNGTFTVAEVVAGTDKSESTVRSAVAQLVTDGAVERAEGRGQYRVVTDKIVDTLANGTVVTTMVEDDATTSITAEPATEHPLGVDLEAELDQDPSHAGLGYIVYAVGANGQELTLKRTGTWVLTDDEQLKNFKSATDQPVSGWAGDKRRAITELRVYLAGDSMSSTPIFVAKPQELKKARSAG